MTKEEQYQELVCRVKECGNLNEKGKCRDGLKKCCNFSKSGVQLIPYEDCAEINLWSYLQGGTSHLNAKILLVGQDWGDVNDAQEIIKEFNFADGCYPEKYCIFIDKNKSKLKTDPNLTELFNSIGYNIRFNQKDLFFTNLVLCYREKGYSGGFRQSWANNCGRYFKELVDIIKPKVILCLGKSTYQGVMKALGGKADKGSYNDIIENHAPSVVGGYKVFPLAHCGSMGTANRNKGYRDKHSDPLYYQKEDWNAIKEYLN